MKTYIFLLLFLTCALQCHGNLPFAGLFASAQDHLHSAVKGVAGTFVGGISGGTKFVEKQFGLNSAKPQKPETVVVIVEEKDVHKHDHPVPPHRPHEGSNAQPLPHSHGPSHPPHSQHGLSPPNEGRPLNYDNGCNDEFDHNYNRPNQGIPFDPNNGYNQFPNENNYNNNGRPNQNGYYNRPNQGKPFSQNNGFDQFPNVNNYNNNGGQNQNGYYNRPNHGQFDQHNGYNQFPNQNNYDNGRPNQNNRPNSYDNRYNNQQNNEFFNKPNEGFVPHGNNNNENFNNQGSTPGQTNFPVTDENQNGNTFTQSTQPPIVQTTASVVKPIENTIPTSTPTDNPEDDPWFVPLNPDDLLGGKNEDTKNEPPKRDTQTAKTKPTEAEEEDFNLDIRMKE